MGALAKLAVLATFVMFCAYVVEGVWFGKCLGGKRKCPMNCTEVTRGAQGGCHWKSGLDVKLDRKILGGGHLIAYKIQWFGGHWSGWYISGYNDMDIKRNLNAKTVKCAHNTVMKKRSRRRMWAYFTDHNHLYIVCQPI